jgi:hypothetical protein
MRTIMREVEGSFISPIHKRVMIIYHICIDGAAMQTYGGSAVSIPCAFCMCTGFDSHVCGLVVASPSFCFFSPFREWLYTTQSITVDD